MRLSVIIVSYNVRYFLEKCLVSVVRAMEGIDGEVIVVDNDSMDQSADMVLRRFPKVHLIPNHDNVGFAKACNQGLRICKGEYALLLNPDTLVSEETFHTCLEFMDNHPHAASCGVHMVDGTGTSLPESMRGLPTPVSAFFKMTGLGSVFPDSPFFNAYYMGGRDRSSVQEVPVLTGAFLFMRMDVIREIGMLDEDYFMYGEDIDLCYRMTKAGYINYYLPEPTIIHYKGESTHREQLRYVIHFYKAMLIYVRKHVHGVGGGLFQFMILLGVTVRGLLSAVRRIVSRSIPVLIDGAAILGITYLVTRYWANAYFQDPGHFNNDFFRFNLPLYSAIWLLFLFLNGAHDKQRSPHRIIYGMGMGTVAILVVYAMLPLEYRSSRAVILLSAVVVAMLLIGITLLWKSLRSSIRRRGRIAVVGGKDEVDRIFEILNRTGSRQAIAGWVAVDSRDTGQQLIGHISQLDELVKTHGITELVFSHDLAFSEVNTWMSRIGPSVSYRISSSGSEQIVGSDSKKEQGTLYTARVEYALAYPMHKRLKRMLDVVTGIIALLLWPFMRILGQGSTRGLRDIAGVISGSKTWVGYLPGDAQIDELPPVREGVLGISGFGVPGTQNEVHMINYIYAREYTIWKDVDLLFRNFLKLFGGPV